MFELILFQPNKRLFTKPDSVHSAEGVNYMRVDNVYDSRTRFDYLYSITLSDWFRLIKSKRGQVFTISSWIRPFPLLSCGKRIFLTLTILNPFTADNTPVYDWRFKHAKQDHCACSTDETFFHDFLVILK